MFTKRYPSSRSTRLLALSAFMLAASSAWAGVDARRQCLIEARQERRACSTICRDDFRAAAEVCRDQNPICADTCRDDRQECRRPILAALDAAVRQCNATLRAALATCRDNTSDPAELDACIDSAQITAFVCRDDAREVALPELNVCKEHFRACILTCDNP